MNIYYNRNRCQPTEITVAGLSETHAQLPFSVCEDSQISHVNRSVISYETYSTTEALNAIFTIMNSYEGNPLSNGHSTGGLQSWVCDERVHTSMSVGDVVELEGTYYLCAPIGWPNIGTFDDHVHPAIVI